MVRSVFYQCFLVFIFLSISLNIEIMVWGYLYRLATRFSPAVVLPISVIIGFIGYRIENLISDKYTPSLESVKEKREDRLLKEDNDVESLKKRSFVPKTIFEKNLSPSLLEPDPRLKKYSKSNS